MHSFRNVMNHNMILNTGLCDSPKYHPVPFTHILIINFSELVLSLIQHYYYFTIYTAGGYPFPAKETS